MTLCSKTINFITRQWTWELRVDPAPPSGYINESTWYIRIVISWECHGQLKSQNLSQVYWILSTTYSYVVILEWPNHFYLREAWQMMPCAQRGIPSVLNHSESGWETPHGTLRTVFSLSVALHVLCVEFAVMVARTVSKPGKSGFLPIPATLIEVTQTSNISTHTQKNSD